MTLTRKQKRLAWLAGALLILIITNPSITAFKAHEGSNTYSGLYRSANLFICSVYDDGGDSYIGLLGNFLRVSSYSAEEVKTNQVASRDTIKQIGAPVSPKYKLWKSLYDSDYYTKTYDDFKKQFSNEESEVRLYVALNKAQYYTKSKQEFINQFFANEN